MNIGLMTDSLREYSLDDMLRVAADAGIVEVEFGCGNWSPAPHVDLDGMLASKAARDEFMQKLDDNGLAISALNCSGNPIAPGELGERSQEVTLKTFRLASELGVEKIVMMSGLPGGPGDANPNWVTNAWPAEAPGILDYQWNTVAIPYWLNLVEVAKQSGVKRVALENHAMQLVYNAPSLLKLRAAVGPTVGANLDPSHVFFLGGDPIAIAGALGEAVFHVHAKDTIVNDAVYRIGGWLETTDFDKPAERAWNYRTLGLGHDEGWWAEFIKALLVAGYDGVLSIEHEDMEMDAEEAVRDTASLLARAIAAAQADLATAT